VEFQQGTKARLPTANTRRRLSSGAASKSIAGDPRIFLPNVVNSRHCFESRGCMYALALASPLLDATKILIKLSSSLAL
jgi:hypothetical protein